MKIRAITVLADVAPPLDADALRRCGSFAASARRAYEEAGFVVQTTRLALGGFPSRMPSPWADDPAARAAELETACQEQGFEYVSLGPFGPALLPLVPEILRRTTSTFATAHIVDPATGHIDGRAVAGAAEVMRRAAQLEAGFGNLRFAALANVPPGGPFFPAAYHAGGAPAFAVATQAADLAVDACRGAPDAEGARVALVAAVEAEARRLVAVGEDLAERHGVRFGGLDFSLAPFPTLACSIGAALEMLTGRPLGAVGTLTAAATLTDALDGADFPHVGFCGLMLPVLEDEVLARRAAEGRLRVSDLLHWSAVCGTGLDTVPLPGDVSADALAGLLFDVAALAVRLDKPLTARLMPLPGKVAGDPVHFDFAYFADGGVLPLGGEDGAGLLGRTSALALHRRRQARA
jgi:hypothetical protein